MARAEHRTKTTEMLPDPIYEELVDLVMVSTPAAIMGVCLALICALAWCDGGGVSFAVLSGLSLAVMGARLATFQAYRGRRAQGPMERSEIARYDEDYQRGVVAFAAVASLAILYLCGRGGPNLLPLLYFFIPNYTLGSAVTGAARPVAARWAFGMPLAAAALAALVLILEAKASLRDAFVLSMLCVVSLLGSAQSSRRHYANTLRQLTMRLDMAALARRDALTDLPNRLQLGERLKAAIDALPHSQRGLIALHFLDLDRFKAVNDTLGHPAGDELLKAVAARLVSVLREGDFAARLGGDEFVVAQLALDTADEAAPLAQRIIDTISAPYTIQGHPVSIGTSIGIAIAPQDGVDLARLAERADAALYNAKLKGRGGFSYWQDLRSAA